MIENARVGILPSLIFLSGWIYWPHGAMLPCPKSSSIRCCVRLEIYLIVWTLSGKVLIEPLQQFRLRAPIVKKASPISLKKSLEACPKKTLVHRIKIEHPRSLISWQKVVSLAITMGNTKAVEQFKQK